MFNKGLAPVRTIFNRCAQWTGRYQLALIHRERPGNSGRRQQRGRCSECPD